MKKITVSILSVLMMLSMVFSSSVFAAEKEVSAWDAFLGLFGAQTSDVSDVGVEYRGHVENKGDFPVDGTWIQGPERLGTVGEGLRLEAFWIKLADTAPAGLHIKYQVHVQNKGWMGFVEDGALAGTEGEALRIEAIQISLVDDEGNIADGYSVEYRGHVQNIGDTEWYADGAQLGTTGSGLRLEALEIKIVQLKADMTAYNAAVAAAAALTETDYTAESWAALQTALTDNVVTEDNTQAEVDAATAAINAAIDALVMVTNVTGAEAVNTKTLEVTFNTAISADDQAKITFAVKKGTTPVTMLAPVWAADGKSAQLARSTNLIAGTYTVTATGIEFGTSVATTEVVAQKISKLEVTTSNVIKATAAKANIAVFDQYDVAMTTKADVFTWSARNMKTSASVLVTPVGANSYIELNTSTATLGDVIRVTGVLSTDPTVTVTKDITVSDIFVADFNFGEIVIPEGQTRINQSGVNQTVSVTYTAADNLGNAVALTAADLGNFTFLSSNTDLVTNPATFALGTEGKLTFTVNANKSGKANLTAFNTMTGETATIELEVFATPSANTATFGDATFIAGDVTTLKLPVTFVDQYGAEMAATTVSNMPLATNFNIAITGVGTLTNDANVSADGKYITFANTATAGTYTFTLTNKTTSAQSSATIVVNAARVPNQLTVVTAPQSTVIVGNTTTPKFTVLDQYGKEMTAATGYSIVATRDAGATAAFTATNPTIGASITSAIQGTNAGSGVVTYTLQKDAVVGPPASAKVDIDSQAFTVAVIANATRMVTTTDKAEYTVGEDIVLTVKAENPNGTFYNKYNETQNATITVGTKTYIRSLAFVNGVATATVPTAEAGATIAVSVNWTSIPGGISNATAIKVNPASASKFALTGTGSAATIGVQLQDNAGNNLTTLTGDQIVKLTFPVGAVKPTGTDADNNLIATFTNGAATITFGANLPAGTYTVTKGDITGTLTVTAVSIPGAAVTGLDNPTNVLQVGGSTRTAATTEAGAGNWTSSDPTVATVNAGTGVVTPVSAGTTTIAYTASITGHVNSQAVTVYAAATDLSASIDFDGAGDTGIVTGQSPRQLQGFTAAVPGTTTATFAVQDATTNVITVNNTGAVTWVSAGGAKTVTYQLVNDATGQVLEDATFTITAS